MTDLDQLAAGALEKVAQDSAPPAVVPQISPTAFHGLAGAIVSAMDPVTAADPAAMLFQLLVMVGNAIGPNAHWRVGAEKHFLNLYCAVIGPTGAGKKGTSLNTVQQFVNEADGPWKLRIKGGLSSGEGVVHHVRDPVISKSRTGETMPLDHGEPDKRMMVIQRELGSVFAVMERQGNTLRDMLLEAWDGGVLETTTKNNPERATGAHISVIGHSTPERMKKNMTWEEAENGLANRFLYCWSLNKKRLPEGGNITHFERNRLVVALKRAIECGKLTKEMNFTTEAQAAWGMNGVDNPASFFDRLEKLPPGVPGMILQRGIPQVRRIACIFAILDESQMVEVCHLEAAMAVWDYCAQTVMHIFGEEIGNKMAENILALLREREDEGIKQSEFYDMWGKTKNATEIKPALSVLEKHQKAFSRKAQHTVGRPAVVWFASEFRNMVEAKATETH